MTWRRTSIVGADQIAPPAGPDICAPAVLILYGRGSASMEWLFQSTLPLAASSATTLPRNVQHGYFGSRAAASSAADTGT